MYWRRMRIHFGVYHHNAVNEFLQKRVWCVEFCLQTGWYLKEITKSLMKVKSKNLKFCLGVENV